MRDVLPDFALFGWAWIADRPTASPWPILERLGPCAVLACGCNASRSSARIAGKGLHCVHLRPARHCTSADAYGCHLLARIAAIRCNLLFAFRRDSVCQTCLVSYGYRDELPGVLTEPILGRGGWRKIRVLLLSAGHQAWSDRCRTCPHCVSYGASNSKALGRVLRCRIGSG